MFRFIFADSVRAVIFRGKRKNPASGGDRLQWSGIQKRNSVAHTQFRFDDPEMKRCNQLFPWIQFRETRPDFRQKRDDFQAASRRQQQIMGADRYFPNHAFVYRTSRAEVLPRNVTTPFLPMIARIRASSSGSSGTIS